MTVIRQETHINGPIERCFDASRDLDLHVKSTDGTHEQAVPTGGLTSGLMGPGQTVTWRATHFGVPQSMTMTITGFDPPHRFIDEMVKGPFKSIRHLHEYTEKDGVTVMKDVFEYQVPFGPLGKLVDLLVLKRHMTGLLTNRAAFLKQAGESTRISNETVTSAEKSA